MIVTVASWNWVLVPIAPATRLAEDVGEETISCKISMSFQLTLSTAWPTQMEPRSLYCSAYEGCECGWLFRISHFEQVELKGMFTFQMSTASLVGPFKSLDVTEVL